MKKIGLCLFIVLFFWASSADAKPCQPGLNLEKCSCPSGKIVGKHGYKKLATDSIRKACLAAVKDAKAKMEKKYGAVTITSWDQIRCGGVERVLDKSYARCWIGYDFSWQNKLKVESHVHHDTKNVLTQKGILRPSRVCRRSDAAHYGNNLLTWRGTLRGEKEGILSVLIDKKEAKRTALLECFKKGKVISFQYKENKVKKKGNLVTPSVESWGTYECKYYPATTIKYYYCAP